MGTNIGLFVTVVISIKSKYLTFYPMWILSSGIKHVILYSDIL